MGKTPVAIIGSGNIGSDLMLKILHRSSSLSVSALIGIDPDSEGLKRAKEHGVPTTSAGLEGFLEMPEFESTPIVFDATSAKAHYHHDQLLAKQEKKIIDLTPAAIGPYVVPTVNLDQHLASPNVNLVTCGGQATIPMVAAVSKAASVRYAEIVASISSRSAGPGTRANIDEFTVTTARGIEQVGGAEKGKAIIVLNPADPPILMRNTVFCLVDADADEKAITKHVEEMATEVQKDVPGYRLKQDVQFDPVGGAGKEVSIPGVADSVVGTRVTVYLEVEGAGDFLPAYAGNLDIMTSAAMATAERLVERTSLAASQSLPEKSS